jgi:hypothetical protein
MKNLSNNSKNVVLLLARSFLKKDKSDRLHVLQAGFDPSLLSLSQNY